MPVRLSARAFDLCLTAGLWEDVSVGSCGCLISPVLTQAQLIDSTLWDSARKLSGPCQINHCRGFHAGHCRLWPQWPVSFCLLTYSNRRVMIFTAARHKGAFYFNFLFFFFFFFFFYKCFDYPEL